MSSNFPLEGWRFDGSYSYGSADFYREIPHVVVNVFPEDKKGLAQDTYRLLKENGLSTTQIREVRHTDGRPHFYVFAERREFLSAREKLFPDLEISTQKRSPSAPHNWLALELRLAMNYIQESLRRLRRWFF